MDFKCATCGAKFYLQRYLTDHNTRVHGTRSRKNKFLCISCPKTFSSENALRSHISRFHEEKELYSVLCREDDCNEKFRTVTDLRNHLFDFHQMKEMGNFQKFEFENYSDFLGWLAQEQINSSSTFNINTKKKGKGCMYLSFACSRSGLYKPKVENRERQLKAQGSKKLGFHCTSNLQVKEYETHVSVVYYPEHYKHSASLCHIPIPESEKEIIAGKLLEGVRERKILQDIRHSLEETVERKHLMTNKDLQNIKRDYGITLASKGSVLANDEASVHSWVEKMKNEEFNPVLFYKRQDDEHSVIEKKDFMLVLMTNFQKSMLSRYGADRVCVDSTHGISGYQFELVTILIIDEYEEGIPVAFSITSTVDTKTLTHFFTCVKFALSRNLSPQIFMSDDAVMFQNAWVSVFGPCSKYLLCAWHVDRAWQKHLNSLKKGIREDIYKSLKSLMYELDDVKFKKMLNNFCEMLEEDINTKEFYKYFIQHYFPRCEMWAYCFRKGAKLNTNMHIESFHKCLKHIYLEGKKTKRIDKVIIELINLVNDKNFDMFIKNLKGKITKKTTENFKRHKVGNNLKAESKQINDNTWKVISDEKKHTVTKMHSCENTCIIACRSCAVCTTAYTCNCHDYAISNFICKHIHFIIMQTSDKEVNFIGPLNNCNDSDTNRAKKNSVKNSKPNIHECNKLKINLLGKKLNTFENMDDSVSLQIKHHLNAIEHLMQVTGESSLTPQNKTNSEPSNKKIILQRRFHSVKKACSCKKIKLSKPTYDEIEAKKSILLKRETLSSNSSKLDHTY